MKSFKSKVFWITGASSGIGRSLSTILIESGAKVVLSSRNAVELESIREKYKENDSNIMVLPLDLSDMKNVDTYVEQVISRFQRVDYLFNNGGISQRSMVSETPLEVDRKVFEVNFFGNIALTKALMQQFIKQGGGHIVVTSSVVGKFGFPLRSAYSASKQALHGFYESLRAENYDNHIKVTMVIPGRINTNISINAVNKNGEKHGKLDPGQANGMDSSTAAVKILRGIHRGRKEVVVGKFDILMVYFRRFTPRLFYFLARKINPK